jgi:hypothetical protein
MKLLGCGRLVDCVGYLGVNSCELCLGVVALHALHSMLFGG